jgi:hypothetical protein
LPQGLYGSDRAGALAQIDARYDRNALIIADLSNDTSYAEQLFETFGPRVMGCISVATAAAWNSSGGESVVAVCSFTALADLICWKPSTVICKRAEFALPMDRRRGALMNNWKASSLKCGRSAWSINVRRGSTIISAFLRHVELGGPSSASGLLDGQRGGGTPAAPPPRLPGLDENNEHIKPIARWCVALRVH